MKKAVISVFACTAVFALLACGKTAASGNSSEASDSTVSTTTVTTSTQTENVQKPTRVNQESQLSPGVQKNEAVYWYETPGRTHHSENHHHH